MVSTGRNCPDLAMPDADGYELIQKIRIKESLGEKQTPAVALTAYVRVEDRSSRSIRGIQYVCSETGGAQRVNQRHRQPGGTCMQRLNSRNLIQAGRCKQTVSLLLSTLRHSTSDAN